MEKLSDERVGYQTMFKKMKRRSDGEIVLRSLVGLLLLVPLSANRESILAFLNRNTPLLPANVELPGPDWHLDITLAMFPFYFHFFSCFRDAG